MKKKKKVVRQRIKNYDNANKLLQTKVDAFIDSKGLASNYNPNLIQSNWQMLGGPDENEIGGETVYKGTPEQIARAKKLLYEHVKRTKGGDTGIIGNGVTETILNEVENEDAIDLARGEGIKLNVKELNKYLPNLQKTASGTDGKAGYSYDNLYANFKSLKANNGQGALAVLNSGGNGDYITGAQLKTKYPSIDLADIDDAQLYVYKSGSNKPTKVNPQVLKDFDIFLNEVNKSNSSITNKSHNAALKLIDRDQEIARLESDGDSNLPPLPGMA